MKILMVDDHTLLRGGIKSTLAIFLPAAQFTEAKDAVEAIQLVRQGDIDIVILDIGLPGRDGIEVLSDIKAISPNLPVLMLSMYPEEQFALRSLKSGASGYLNKEVDGKELAAAIQCAVRGEKYLSPALAQKLAFALIEGGDKPLHENLSDREYQILCLIGSGKTVSQIAASLFLSVKTVSTHRTNILRKMEFQTSSDLMRYALKNGLSH